MATKEAAFIEDSTKGSASLKSKETIWHHYFFFSLSGFRFNYKGIFRKNTHTHMIYLLQIYNDLWYRAVNSEVYGLSFLFSSTFPNFDVANIVKTTKQCFFSANKYILIFFIFNELLESSAGSCLGHVYLEIKFALYFEICIVKL